MASLLVSAGREAAGQSPRGMGAGVSGMIGQGVK
jgi:hypothetical protein